MMRRRRGERRRRAEEEQRVLHTCNQEMRVCCRRFFHTKKASGSEMTISNMPHIARKSERRLKVT